MCRLSGCLFGAEVRLLDSVAPGTNVRPIGCDIAEGELVRATHTDMHVTLRTRTACWTLRPSDRCAACSLACRLVGRVSAAECWQCSIRG